MSKKGYKRDGRIDLRRLPRIIERPLQQHASRDHFVFGLSSQLLHHDASGETEYRRDPGWEPTIWLDPRVQGREELETVIHEALHLACPWMFEDVVRPVARYVAMVVWRMQWRRKNRSPQPKS